MPGDICACNGGHPSEILRIRKGLASDTEFFELSEIFKVLGDPNRLRMMQALALGELCVCDLTDLTGLSQSATSHHLRLLRTSRLVRFRREGKNIFYSLDDRHIRTLMDVALAHVRGEFCDPPPAS